MQLSLAGHGVESRHSCYGNHNEDEYNTACIDRILLKSCQRTYAW